MNVPARWWVIFGPALLAALRRAYAGEHPDRLYAELYDLSSRESVE